MFETNSKFTVSNGFYQLSLERVLEPAIGRLGFTGFFKYR